MNKVVKQVYYVLYFKLPWAVQNRLLTLRSQIDWALAQCQQPRFMCCEIMSFTPKTFEEVCSRVNNWQIFSVISGEIFSLDHTLQLRLESRSLLASCKRLMSGLESCIITSCLRPPRFFDRKHWRVMIQVKICIFNPIRINPQYLCSFRELVKGYIWRIDTLHLARVLDNGNWQEVKSFSLH